MLELYHDWSAVCCLKVRLCLAEKNLAWESRVIDLLKLEQLKSEYLRLNSNGVVPTLVHDGNALWESSLINEYLNEVFPAVNLVPDHPVEKARMRYWVKFEDDVLFPIVGSATVNLIIRQALSGLPKDLVEERLTQHPNPDRAAVLRNALNKPEVDVQAVEDANQRMDKALERMERRLSEAPWFAGETYSLADTASAALIERLEELNFMGLWKNKPAVKNWIDRVKARPAYQIALLQTTQRMPKPDWN
jgi:glutathione S-transferase